MDGLEINARTVLDIEPMIQEMLQHMDVGQVESAEASTAELCQLLSQGSNGLRIQNAACVIRARVLRRLGEVVGDGRGRNRWSGNNVPRYVKSHALLLAGMDADAFEGLCNWEAVSSEGSEISIKDFAKLARKLRKKDRDEQQDAGTVGVGSEPGDVPAAPFSGSNAATLWLDPLWGIPGMPANNESAISGEMFPGWSKPFLKSASKEFLLFVSTPNEYLADVLGAFPKLQYRMTYVTRRYEHSHAGTKHCAGFLPLFASRATLRTSKFATAIQDEREHILKVGREPMVKCGGVTAEGFHFMEG